MSEPTQIAVPQRNPPPVTFQQPDLSGIAAIYNRPKPAEIGAELLGKGVNQYLDNYYKQQQLKASAFGEGGPYLYNLLYGQGGGQQGQQGQQPVGGGNPSGPNQNMTSQNQTPPPQPAAPPQQGMSSMGGQGGATPPQSQPVSGGPNPQQPGQPLMHPTSGLPQTIHDSIAAGLPDHSGIVSQPPQSGSPDFAGYGQQIGNLTNQMGQSANMYGPSKFGQANQNMLGGQLSALKTGMEAQTAPLNYQKTANEVAMQPGQAALQQQQLLNAKEEYPTMIGKASADQQNKYQLPEMKIQVASQKLQDLYDAYNKVPQSQKGAGVGLLTSKAGSVAGNVSPELVTYNKVRDAAAVSLAIARNPENPRPSPQDIQDELKNLPSAGDAPKVAMNLFNSTASDLKNIHTLNTNAYSSSAQAFGGSIKPSPTPQLNMGSQGQGKIRVSNGKQSFMIDPKDAAEAAKDGFK